MQVREGRPARESGEDYEREIARREALAERVASHQQAELVYDAHKAGLDARRQTLQDGLLFQIPTLYGGNN